MKIKIALLLTVLAAGLAFAGCTTMDDHDDSDRPSAAPAHRH